MTRLKRRWPPNGIVITSCDNRQVKIARSLRRRKGRQSEGAYLVEGVRATLDTLRSTVPAQRIFLSDEMLGAERAVELWDAAEESETEAIEVSVEVLRSLAQSESPQGVVAVIAKPQLGLSDIEPGEQPLILIAHEVRDPGNLGTMIRTAHAAGCQAVVISGDSVDPYNEKCVRASTASLAQVPVVDGAELAEACAWAQGAGMHLVATTPWAKKTCYETDLTVSAGVLVGGEARGLGDLVKFADESVAIPMPGGAQSLNVAVATGVLLFEAVRQRHFQMPF